MSDYEIKEALQLRQQRFEAALTIFVQQGKMKPTTKANLDAAIETADLLIAKLEAPTIKPDEGTPYG